MPSCVVFGRVYAHYAIEDVPRADKIDILHLKTQNNSTEQ